MRPNPSTKPRRLVSFLATAFAAVAMLLSLSPGIGAQAGPDQALQNQASVTVKLVQVYVTAKRGAPVTDLTPGDFEVTDNGQVYPVTHFEKHFLNAGETPASPSAIPLTNRRFFLLFDFAFMDPRGVLKAKNAGLQFLSTEIQPTDEIGLVSYSASRGLVVHEYLTTDHERIRRMVDGFGLRRYVGRAENLTDFVYTADLTEERPTNVDSGGALMENAPDEQFYMNQARLQTSQRMDDGRRQSYVDQAREMIRSLNILAKALRAVPGFKNIIFFSGGLARQLIYGKAGAVEGLGQWNTPEELAQAMSAYDAAQADSGLRDDFTAMLKEFKAANSPVYAVDVSRAQKEVDSSIQEGAGPALRGIDGADSLKQFASGTGGKFFANTMEAVKIATAIQDSTSAYYVLGYSVDEKWDGKFHKIKVKVNRKGVKVDAQGGYFSAKPFSDYTKFEKLFQVVDLALSESPQVQVPYEIPVAGMSVMVKGWPQLLVFGRASLAVHTDVLGKTSEAYLMLFDEKGDMAYVKRFLLAIPETGKETLFPAFLMPVKPGTYDCRLVVRNLDTGRAARGGVPLVVTAAGAGAAMTLDPPLLLGPSTNSLDLAASPGSSLAELFAYDANAYAPLLGDVPAELTKLRAALRLTGSSAAGEPEITVTLVDSATSARTELPVSVLKQGTDGTAKLLFLEMTIGELKPGAYTIGFAAKDQGTGTTAVSSAAITVK
ncbi:MAG: VWA domain-containing protein [Candidatus Aminicenantes bacterium]|nr:VWA domain-containing protein [Candidatus Aminicenantes bacterium]